MARQHIVPKENEIVMRDDDFIVSKTDLKGRITYANRIFMEFSVEAGREIFAYVKNICADGSYYWVLANVTPSFDDTGKVVGYYSVRRKPNANAIRFIADLYKRMIKIEADAGSKEAIAASTRYLNDLLSEKGISYEEFILQLQSA